VIESVRRLPNAPTYGVNLEETAFALWLRVFLSFAQLRKIYYPLDAFSHTVHNNTHNAKREG
jgi:hypothetical protein